LLLYTGKHPELIYLQAELLKRRDKRLELASRKRSYEVANVTKRRKADEGATWSWWKVGWCCNRRTALLLTKGPQFSRDELQTDMISETNRKRRRMERDRRALERPQPGKFWAWSTPIGVSNWDPKYAAFHFLHTTLLHLPLCAKSSKDSLSLATAVVKANEISTLLLQPSSYIPSYLPFLQETLLGTFNTCIRIGDTLLILTELGLIWMQVAWI
jgi:hypothetical protein